MTLWSLSEHDGRMDVVDEISTQWGFDDSIDDRVWIGGGGGRSLYTFVALPTYRS